MMNSRLFNRIFGLIGVVSCWWMAYNFYATWQTPMEIENGEWVFLSIGILIAEFVIVHSGVFIPVIIKGFQKSSFIKSEQLKFLADRPYIVVGLMYGVFIIAVLINFKSMLLFWNFLGIMISRYINSRRIAGSAMEWQMIKRSIVSAELLFVLLLLSAFVIFPKGGLTPEIVAMLRPKKGGGLWVDNPQQPLLMGAIYFSLMGLIELVWLFKKDPVANLPASEQNKIRMK